MNGTPFCNLERSGRERGNLFILFRLAEFVGVTAE
jgi:hypothetical protein